MTRPHVADACLVITDGGIAIGEVRTRGDSVVVRVEHTGETISVLPEHVIEHADLREGDVASAFLARVFGALRFENIATAARVDAAKES